MSEMPRWNSLGLSVYDLKNGQEEKTGPFWEWVPESGEGVKKGRKEGKYGRCVLYSCMKTE
jgi:hypothetical protein